MYFKSKIENIWSRLHHTMRPQYLQAKQTQIVVICVLNFILFNVQSCFHIFSLIMFSFYFSRRVQVALVGTLQIHQWNTISCIKKGATEYNLFLLQVLPAQLGYVYILLCYNFVVCGLIRRPFGIIWKWILLGACN